MVTVVFVALCTAANAESGWNTTIWYAEPTRPENTQT